MSVNTFVTHLWSRCLSLGLTFDRSHTHFGKHIIHTFCLSLGSFHNFPCPHLLIMKRAYDSSSEGEDLDESIANSSIVDMDADEAQFSPPATPKPPAPLPSAPVLKPLPNVKPPAVEKLKQPKHKADKGLTSILQAHLPSAVAVGDLQTVFVTILPDLQKSKEEAWKEAESDLMTIRIVCGCIPGMVLTFVALETHPGTRPKASKKGNKKKKKKKGAGSDEEEEEEEAEEEEEEKKEESNADTTKSVRINPRTHYPHYHVLLYFSCTSMPRIDYSYVKRQLLEKFPGGDIQDKRRTKQTSDQRGASFVSITSYVLKGAHCNATADNWKKYVDPSEKTSPPLPRCYDGEQFSYSKESLLSECCQRLAVMLTKITNWCETAITVPSPLLNSVIFREENEITLEHRAMREFAILLRTRGVYVGVKRQRGLFFRKAFRVDYEVTNTFSEPMSLVQLKQFLSMESTQAEGYLLKYGKRLSDWFDMIGTFDYVPSHRFEWVELSDSYYCITEHKFVMKQTPPKDFPHTCFRAYGYSRAELEASSPTEWEKLVEHVCGEPDQSARFRAANRLESSGASCATERIQAISRDSLLRELALLLRRRHGKQPVPFLWGSKDTGKTTVVRFILDLYPDDAVASISDCVTPLATLHEDTAILFQDEFNSNTIKRELLLRLLDGSQRLDVRRMHQNPELISNPLMPIVLTDNYKPAYRNDDSEALDTRLVYFHFTRPIPTKDYKVVEKIIGEHLFIVYYLNKYLCNMAKL